MNFRARADCVEARAHPFIRKRQKDNEVATIKQTLDELLTLDGALCAAIVDSSSGMMLGSAGSGVDLEVAAAGNTEVVRAKLKTTAPFVPRGVRAKAESIAEFAMLQGRIAELIHEAAEFDLRRIKIVSPFDKRVKYNVFSAFRILIAHQRRHLWQAEQAVETLRRMHTRAA